MAAIFAQDPYQFIKDKAVPKSLLFSRSDASAVKEMADFLIGKKKSGYKLMDPIAYYEHVKKWIEGELEWDCGAGKTIFAVDVNGRLSICGYLPFLDLTLWDLETEYYQQLRPVREMYLPRCSRKCLPSCMFSTYYYLKHPLRAVTTIGV